jgi:PAS domain S-box-containing protein
VIPVGRALGIVLAVLVMTAPRMAPGGERPRRVLILESFGRDVGPLTRMIQAFRAELRTRWPEPIDLFEVSLESARANQPAEEESLVNFLSERLARDPVDLVVPFGPPAMGFVSRHRKRLFPRSPILVAGVERRLVTPEFLGPSSVVVGPRFDITGTVEDILRLLPETREIAVVFGASPLEQYWVAEYRRAFARLENRVRFRWLDGQPFEAMKREVAALPANSAVLYPILIRDAAGASFEQDQAILGLRAVSSAPMFAISESQLGSGIVGGRLLPDRSLGLKAAGVALRILRGEDPARIASPPLSTLPPAFDWRELKHWRIDEARLPPGSTIVFRPPSFWELYRWHVLGVLGVVSLQSALIAGLLLQRRRSNRAERQLQQSERRLLLIADSLPALISYVDRSEHYVFINNAYRTWFDIDPAAARGRTMAEVLGAEVYRKFRPQIERVLRGEQVTSAEEISPVRGQRRSIEAIYVPDCDERGVVRGFYVLVVDVTDRRRAEREMRQLKDQLAHSGRIATIGEMAGALAHELNQPLAAILSNAQAAIRFLKSATPDLDEVREILRDIAVDDTRAGEIIRRIRSLVKKDAADLRTLGINDVVEEVVGLLHSDALIRGVTVTLELEPGLSRIQGDRIQLQQVLLNLLLNAFDAMGELMPGERSVTIRSRQVDSFVMVTVSDLGTGIQAGHPDELFEPFRTTKPNGLGLGLSISRSIVANHGGRLWAENNRGRGATFGFTLPARAAMALVG